ncbi:MAG TPA: phosphodiester glycosidase family protein [Pyrinomonadaceae bacterium]
MKKISVSICVYLWLIIFCLSISAQDFKVVQDGIEYAELERVIDKTPVKMNLLRLDLTKVRLDVVHAFDSAIGVEKTSSIAARHGAIAAINAGFFRLDNSLLAGEAAGILQIDDNLLSESNQTRIALFISNDANRTDVKIGHLDAWATVTINKKFFQISGINTERKDNELILYTPEFNRTTLTESSGIEIVVRKNKVVKVNVNKGSTEIPADGFVLSATGKGIVPADFLEYAKVKSKVRLAYNFARIDKGETDASGEDIVGGVPQLIRNGQIEITWEQEKTSKSFVETRHPRTAVARLKDGKFLMVTVDGRSESSGGIGLEDLAKLLLEFGAVDAMNLDGGGSTTMFLDGKIVNHPSDKEGERKVSDAILVFPRKKN